MKNWRAALPCGFVVGFSILCASVGNGISHEGWARLYQLDFWIIKAVSVGGSLIVCMTILIWGLEVEERRKQRHATLNADIDDLFTPLIEQDTETDVVPAKDAMRREIEP